MVIRVSQPQRNLYFLILVGVVILVLPACSTSGKNDLPQSFQTTIEASSPPSLPSPLPTESSSSIPATPVETAQPSAPLTPPDEGENRFKALKANLDVGEIRSLWIDPDGQLWVGTPSGIYVYSDNNWEKIYQGAVELILGADANGVVWVLLEEELEIAAYHSPGVWQVFGAEHGWTKPEDMEYLSPGYGDGIVTNAQGMVWLATGREDVRLFDPEMRDWIVLTPADIGYSPAGDDRYQGHFLSDVELSDNQQIWVADCIGEGESLKGQGIRWSDGESWFEFPETAAECVQDIEIDFEGKMWVGGFDALLRYDPDLDNWTRFPLPSWERRQVVTEIDLADDGSPWVEVIRYGGASPLGNIVRYILGDGGWYQVYEGWFSSLAFGEPGVAWLCSEGAIFRLESNNLEQVGEIPGTLCDIKMDGSGRLWMTNFSELWWFDPED